MKRYFFFPNNNLKQKFRENNVMAQFTIHHDKTLVLTAERLFYYYYYNAELLALDKAPWCSAVRSVFTSHNMQLNRSRLQSSILKWNRSFCQHISWTLEVILKHNIKIKLIHNKPKTFMQLIVSYQFLIFCIYFLHHYQFLYVTLFCITKMPSLPFFHYNVLLHKVF